MKLLSSKTLPQIFLKWNKSLYEWNILFAQIFWVSSKSANHGVRVWKYRVEEKYASAPKSKIFLRAFWYFQKEKIVIRTGKGLQLIYI